MTWYAVNLGDAMLADASLERIAATLEAEWSRLGHPIGAAAFVSHESEGRLHCEVKVYLAPGFRDEAARLEAEPCGRPLREGLGLLVGSEASWAVLFPEGDD